MESKKIFLSLILLISIMMFLNSIQAKIVLSNPVEQYNLGDEIKQDIKVLTIEPFNGFLRASLVCEMSSATPIISEVNTTNSTKTNKTNSSAPAQNTQTVSSVINSTVLLYYSPIATESNKEKSVSFSINAQNPGKCYILASLERQDKKIEEARTSIFLITSSINIEAVLNKQLFSPEQQLKVTGKIIMANGKEFNGAAIIFLDKRNFSSVVSKGSFSQTITLEKKISPGKHFLTIQASDDKGNFGIGNLTFEVTTIKTSLDIKVNNQTIMPDEILVITPSVLDQAGNIISENISLRLVQLNDLALTMQKRIILLEEIVLSGNSTQYKFAKDASPQDYTLEATGSGFAEQKTITVPRVEKINYTIIQSNGTENSVLVIKNIGNVKYQKPLEINFVIEDVSINKVIDVSLDVNEERTYSLNMIKGPEGLYKVTLKSEGEIKSFTDIPITGKVSSFLNLDSNETFKDFPWLILPLILIAALTIFLVFIRRDFFIKLFKSKKKTKVAEKLYGFETYNEQKTLPLKKESQKPISSFSSPKRSEPIKMSAFQKKTSMEKTEKAAMKDSQRFSTKNELIQDIYERNADSMLPAIKIIPATITGQKQEVTLLNIRINGLNYLTNLKNTDSYLFKELSEQFFSNVIKRISANSGVSGFYDNHLMIMFNVIPQANHASLAVKTAQEIKKIIEEFNQQLSSKKQLFEFNVAAGIHTGPLVLTSIGLDKSIKYSPIQDTTTIAQALEKKAFKNEILLSEMTYNKVSGIVQTKKITPVTIGNKAIPTYLVQEQAEKKKDSPYWMK